MRRERPKKVHLSSQGKRDVFHKLITFPIFDAYRSKNCKKSPLIDNSSIFLLPEQKNHHINQLIDNFKFFGHFSSSNACFEQVQERLYFCNFINHISSYLRCYNFIFGLISNSACSKMVQEEKGRIELNRKRCCTFMYLFEFVQLCTFVVVHLCKRCCALVHFCTCLVRAKQSKMIGKMFFG